MNQNCVIIQRQSLKEELPILSCSKDPKKINSEETMRKGYSEDVPDANPDYQPAYDTQEQPWPWSMNQRYVYRSSSGVVKM